MSVKNIYGSTADRSELQTFLRRLTTGGRQTRLVLINHLTSKDCALIRQVSYNVLFNSSIQLKEIDRQYLTKHIGLIRSLASRRISIRDKRRDLDKKQFVLKRLAKITLEYLEDETDDEDTNPKTVDKNEEVRTDTVRPVHVYENENEIVSTRYDSYTDGGDREIVEEKNDAYSDGEVSPSVAENTNSARITNASS